MRQLTVQTDYLQTNFHATTREVTAGSIMITAKKGIINALHVCLLKAYYHFYADDIQLYFSFYESEEWSEEALVFAKLFGHIGGWSTITN